MDYFNAYLDMLNLRGLTDHTIRSYSTYIRAFLSYLDTVLHKSPLEVSWHELRLFIFWIQDQRDLTDRTVNHCISQLRFFWLYVLHLPWDPFQLPMRKFDTYLPFVPSRSQVIAFLSSIPHLKYRTMVTLMYSSGLRIGELCHLRYEDIERSNRRIHIARSKNRSDRFSILSTQALELLTDYWFAYDRPKGWLFPSQLDPLKPFNDNYLKNIIHRHKLHFEWATRLTSHSFRHAFGTHLYEDGTDILQIQKLMGHRSVYSTQIYIHLASFSGCDVQSPLDRIGELHNV